MDFSWLAFWSPVHYADIVHVGKRVKNVQFFSWACLLLRKRPGGAHDLNIKDTVPNMGSIFWAVNCMLISVSLHCWTRLSVNHYILDHMRLLVFLHKHTCFVVTFTGVEIKW